MLYYALVNSKIDPAFIFNGLCIKGGTYVITLYRPTLNILQTSVVRHVSNSHKLKQTDVKVS